MKTIEQILQEMLGSQMMQIASLTAENMKLKEQIKVLNNQIPKDNDDIKKELPIKSVK